MSQAYSRGEQLVISPSQVMTDHYVQIPLPQEAKAVSAFDRHNAYTYVQLINEEFGKTSQLIYQTDFFGRLLYLAYSNNLASVFNNVDKPMNTFVSCMKRVNENISPVQNVDQAVRCVIERLNYCSGK